MELEHEISRMISEGSPVSAVDDPCSKNTRHPERNGRIKPTDPVLRSIEEMDMVSGGWR